MNELTTSALSTLTAERWKQQRFNPLPSLTPQLLSSYIDRFEAGYLRTFSLAAKEIMDRDDTLASVVPKRKRRVSRRPWDVLIGEDVPEELKAQAEEHQQALKSFYSSLVFRNSVDLNEQGGLRLLIRRMMEAQFLRYATAQIEWQPTPDGMRATLYYVPLEFMDASKGELRFAGVNGNTPGSVINKKDWLIAVSDGCIMKAASVCYMFKRLSLADWLNYSGKFGVPAVHGTTNAPYGSAEWDRAVNALAKYANDLVMLTDDGFKINLVTPSGGGESPFQPMVDRMDRAMVRLVMGSDLATMSRENGAGASLQATEADELICDDCEWISELFNEQLSRQVIEWQFGPGTEPLAFFQLQGPQNKDTKLEIEVDKHVREMGVNQSVEAIAERYGRTHEEPTPEQVQQQQQQARQSQQQSSQEDDTETPPAANERAASAFSPKYDTLLDRFRTAVHKDLMPAREALLMLENAKSVNEIQAAILTLSANITEIEARVMDGQATNDILDQSTAAELLSAFSAFGKNPNSPN